jgi:hypothetical protein
MTLPAKRSAFRIPTKYRFSASHDERSLDARGSVGGQQPAITIPNDGELAWQLAAEVTEHLREVDRVSIYLKIGCGDHYEAIVQMLELVSRHRMRLSAAIEACLRRWADGYADTACEPAIRGCSIVVGRRWTEIHSAGRCRLRLSQAHSGKSRRPATPIPLRPRLQRALWEI